MFISDDIKYSMERFGRLDTETLIQECRNGYDASKIRERVQELQLTLDLRNKELQFLTSQVADCKQEASIKALTLQESIGKLQREIADMRITVIKTKRAESQRAEQQIRSVRQQCQKQLADQQTSFSKAFQIQQEKFVQQIRRAEQKNSQFTHFNREETATLKTLKEQKYASIQMYVKSLEAEKLQLLLGKRETEKKWQNLNETYDKMKVQYEKSLTNKEEVISQLKGQISSLKLKEKLISQNLEEEKHQFSDYKINSKYEQQQLTMTIQKLLKERQQLNGMLEDKNEELLQIIEMQSKSFVDRMNLPPTEGCEHIGLIQQLQRSIQLKETQLKQLQTIVQEWGEQIGFNQPVTSRYQKLLSTAEKTEQMKSNQIKTLKDKTRQMNVLQRRK